MPVAPPELAVSQSDLDVLFDHDPDSESRYHGVYPEKSGWVAKAFRRRVGPSQGTPREAAIQLVRWWKGRYGDRWREAWHYRQTTGWAAVRVRGGVWAVAEVCGRASVLVGLGADGRGCEAGSSPGCRPFPDRAAAARGVREWAEREWGEEGRLVVRRTWAAEAGRARTPVPRTAGC